MEIRDLLLRLAVAALGGLAVGVEREWSANRETESSRFGGVRTFLLLGLLGGLAAVLAEWDPWLAALPLAGGALVVVTAYLVTAWRGVVDATTEVAGMVVLAAGALAGGGQLTVASAVFAGTALVLAEKGGMHAAVARIRSEELQAAARFAVLALVVLPLLPAERYGPAGGVSPRELWVMVLLFAGLSFAGYVALRAVGPGRGYPLAGLLGGLVSSTAVTINFARESRRPESDAHALGAGALAASVVLPVRVLVLAGVIELAVARALGPALVPALVAGAAIVVLALRRPGRPAAAGPDLLPGNPLRLGAALQLALLFAVVLVALGFLRERYGAGGLLGGAALLGLTDLDALTYSAAHLVRSGTPAETAARALLVGQLANTLFKGTLAVTLGAGAFRRVCGGGLLVFAAAYAIGLVILAR